MNSIVEDLLEKLKQCDDFHNRCDYLIEHSEITYLLDYITNLQQENERLKENNSYMQEEMARVWEENERLKEDLKGQENLTLSYCKSEQDYKSRCEKAIEYLQYAVPFRYQDLLNILQNESENK